MDQDGCGCLLCETPLDEASWDERDRRIVKSVREHDWHVTGVAGGPEGPAGWAYSIGLWHTLRSPEVCIFGLRTGTMTTIVNIVGDQVRSGHTLRPGERRADVLDGRDVAVRPVHASWCPGFFGAGIDFYRVPPLPVVQVFWPDEAGRFPWDEDAQEYCRTGQPKLWIARSQSDGPWTEPGRDAKWPFTGTLPYQKVFTTRRVLVGESPVTRIVHDRDGRWHFLGTEVDGAAGEAVQTPLRQILDRHPDVVRAAGLTAGWEARRGPDGRWLEHPAG